MTTVALVGACVVLLARTASAQAFVPEAGGGSITIAYQNLFARGHLDLNGDRMPGPSLPIRLVATRSSWRLNSD